MKGTNKIILGTVQFGLNYGINNKFGITKYNEVQKILNYAYNYGIKFLDTAYAYGQAHEIIGLYHQDNPKNQFKIINYFFFSFWSSIPMRRNKTCFVFQNIFEFFKSIYLCHMCISIF